MKIVVERPVCADAERLWGFVGRVADWADLLPTVDDVEIVDGGPTPHIGARYALRQPGLPRLVYEVTEWVPGERFTWVAAAPGVRTIGSHTISPARDGCVLTLTLRWTGPLPARRNGVRQPDAALRRARGGRVHGTGGEPPSAR